MKAVGEAKGATQGRQTGMGQSIRRWEVVTGVALHLGHRTGWGCAWFSRLLLLTVLENKMPEKILWRIDFVDSLLTFRLLIFLEFFKVLNDSALFKGDLATASRKFSFWRITHFTSRHQTYITVTSRPGNLKRSFFIFRPVLNFLVVRCKLCRPIFYIQIANHFVYKSTSANSWYRNHEVSNAPKTEFSIRRR